MVLYTGPFIGTERMPIIIPDTTVSTGFTNRAITLAELSTLVPFGAFPPTILTSGATTGSPYAATATDFLILVNKTVSANTGILFPTSVGRVLPILVKDLKGDAATYNIHVTFTGGQSADAQTDYTLIGNYVWQWFYPYSGGWYAA
jgi:hypothetical protein